MEMVTGEELLPSGIINNIDRLIYMYSEENVNADPEVIIFWAGVIKRACLSRHSFEFTCNGDNSLVEQMTVNDLYPSSLLHAVQYMLSEQQCQRKLYMKSSFAALSNSSMDKWTLQSIGSVIYSTIFIGNPASDIELVGRSTLLCGGLLSDAAQVVIVYADMISASSNSLDGEIPIKRSYRGNESFVMCYFIHSNPTIHHLSFLNLVQSAAHEAETLLQYLKMKGFAVIKESAAHIGGSASLATMESINVGVDVLQLDCAVSMLTVKLTEYEYARQELTQQAIACKRKGQTEKALLALSQRRRIQALATSVAAALASLHEAQEKIGQCVLNKLLVESYDAAARGMRESRLVANVSENTAADAVERFQEEMDELDAITVVLAGQDSTINSSEQEELEKELNELMAGTNEGRIDTFPEPPQGKLSKSSMVEQQPIGSKQTKPTSINSDENNEDVKMEAAM